MSIESQPITPPKPESQEPNAMERAVLLLPTSHQLDAGLPGMFLELREDRIGRTGHTITARNWAGTMEAIPLSSTMLNIFSAIIVSLEGHVTTFADVPT